MEGCTGVWGSVGAPLPDAEGAKPTVEGHGSLSALHVEQGVHPIPPLNPRRHYGSGISGVRRGVGFHQGCGGRGGYYGQMVKLLLRVLRRPAKCKKHPPLLHFSIPEFCQLQL